MIKVLLVGAGSQGGPCTSILCRDKAISEIRLGDIDLALANRVREKIGSSKITTIGLNAESSEELEKAAEGVDIILNLTLCRYNHNIIEAALKKGVHYVDSAFHEDMWKELINKREGNINERFKNIGRTCLVGCGGAPGLSNVIVRYVSDKLDSISNIHIRVGRKLVRDSEDPIRTWEPSWCPEVALADYANEPTVYENGVYKRYPPFSGIEEYNFPYPIGPLKIAYHHHEEPLTLPSTLRKGISNVWFKYPVDPIVGALIKLGFGKREPIRVKEMEVAPCDVLLQMVTAPVDNFLMEDENNTKLPDKYHHLYMIEINGQKAMEDMKYCVSWSFPLYTSVDEKIELFEKFGTTKIAIALPIIAGAKMCLNGMAGDGLIFAENLTPSDFFKEISKIGWRIVFREERIRDVCIRD